MMKKILVPIDGSDISLRAMNFAIELGKHLQVRLLSSMWIFPTT